MRKAPQGLKDLIGTERQEVDKRSFKTFELNDLIETERREIAKHSFKMIKLIAEEIRASGEGEAAAKRDRLAPLLTQCINQVMSWTIDRGLYMETLPMGWWHRTHGAGRHDVFNGMEMSVLGRDGSTKISICPLAPTQGDLVRVYPSESIPRHRMEVFGNAAVDP